MMSLRGQFLFLSLIAGAVCLAQDLSAEAYFNKASKEYVKQDKMQALRTLDAALRAHPGDPRLLKLAEELVKEEEKKQQQQQQQQEQQEQGEQQEKEQEQQKNQDQSAQDQQEKQQQDKQEQQQPAERQEQNGQPRSGQIAPQDAMRMLDALERSEKDVQEKVRVKRRPVTRRTIDKEW